MSTLEAIAYPLRGTDCIACAVMDARCAQVYCAIFENGKRLCDDKAVYIKDLGEELKQYDKNNEINPNVIIDPLLFRKYNITQAPCVVFAQNTQTKDFSQSEGNDENFNAKNIYKSCGAWNLQWHLKQIQQKANSSELEEIISYLEPKGGV